MLTTQTPTEDAGLNEVIAMVLAKLKDLDPASDEFAKITSQLQKLYALKPSPKERGISPDTLATVIANLAGIVLILGYERAHVVTSKALGFVSKLKV